VAASAGSAFATRVSFRRNGAPAAVPISISPVVNAGWSESSREIPKASNGTRTIRDERAEDPLGVTEGTRDLPERVAEADGEHARHGKHEHRGGEERLEGFDHRHDGWAMVSGVETSFTCASSGIGGRLASHWA
jgi:hypothetical protein